MFSRDKSKHIFLPPNFLD